MAEQVRKLKVYSFIFHGIEIRGTVAEIAAKLPVSERIVRSRLSEGDDDMGGHHIGYNHPVYEAIDADTLKITASGTMDQIAEQLGYSTRSLYAVRHIKFRRTGDYQYEELPESVDAAEAFLENQKKESLEELKKQVGRIKFLQRNVSYAPPVTELMLRRLKEYGLTVDEIPEIEVDLNYETENTLQPS